MGGCEWDPERNAPAEDIDEHHRTAPVEVIVGANGLWRLCAECAALPEFRRLRKRKRIERMR